MLMLKIVFFFRTEIGKSFLLFSLLAFCDLFNVCSSHGRGLPKLLLVSFDGFRWDYLNRVATPNFDKIIKNGVQAKRGLKNVFITKTFPNHFTLVTGLYVESHGVVANSMFDPDFNESFTIFNITQTTESKWFDNGGEPIWVTNELKSSKRKSGILFWPGSSASVKNTYPTKYSIFNTELPFKTRVDVVLSWFKDKYPVNLGHLYFEEPDFTGHQAGPESVNVTRKIAEVDGIVGYLLEELEKLDLIEHMNIIITSDHGMTSTPPDKVINLDTYIDPKSYRVFSATPSLLLLPNDEEKTEEIYKNLSTVQNMKVYRKKDIPDEYHYKNNRRILPLLVVADEHYSFTYKGAPDHVLGNHGYNNSLPSMHPFFMAMGPAFKKQASIDTFNSVDIYPMMCHILALEPAPNNGSLKNVMSLLKEHDEEGSVSTFATYVMVMVFCGLFSGICSIAACRQYRYSLKTRQFSVKTIPGPFKYSSPPNNQATSRLLSSDSEDLYP